VHFHCGRDGGSASAGDDILPEQQLVRIPGAELLPLIEALRMECGRRDEAATSIRQGLLLVLVGRLARAMDRDLLGVRHVVAAPAPALHERLAVVFRRHEARHLAVRTMARDLGMSERHLAAECRARLGISPARAFTAHRMARAAELLAGTGLPVKAVADRLGFSNPFHFSRVFHRTHGCTPSGFRRCMRDPGHAIGA
jgi:AraC-like DNA-binding protein